MALYSLSAVQQTIDAWVEAGGQVDTVKEGSLGWGLTICHGDGLKTAIITEVCLNEWSSAHKIRIYNEMPKKYRKMLDDMENQEAEDYKTVYYILADVWDADKEEYNCEKICESENYEFVKRRFDSVSSNLTKDMMQITLYKDSEWETEKLLQSVLMEDGVYTTDDF